MAIRIMIIEMSKDYRSLLTHHLTTHWSDAKIVEYDPDESGRLSEEFAGADNDLIILGESTCILEVYIFDFGGIHDVVKVYAIHSSPNIILNGSINSLFDNSSINDPP